MDKSISTYTRNYADDPKSPYKDIDFAGAVKKSKGFNGADIESVINEAAETCFVGKKKLTKEIIEEIIDKTTSISRSCEEQINAMEKMFESSSFVDATTGDLTKKTTKTENNKN